MNNRNGRPIEILLVEDNPADQAMTVEALQVSKVINHLSVAEDGEEAMAFLRREGRFADAPAPDLVLLDLNLPRMDGREVLVAIKQDADLKHIPVVVLTTSQDEEDVQRAYRCHANCYITKPVNMTQFVKVVGAIDHFWFSVVTLPEEA